jgi:hypothetical protein
MNVSGLIDESYDFYQYKHIVFGLIQKYIGYSEEEGRDELIPYVANWHDMQHWVLRNDCVITTLRKTIKMGYKNRSFFFCSMPKV